MKNFKWLGRRIGGCYRGVQVIVHDTKGGIPKTGGAYKVELQSTESMTIEFSGGDEDGFDPDQIESYCEEAIKMFIEDGLFSEKKVKTKKASSLVNQKQMESHMSKKKVTTKKSSSLVNQKQLAEYLASECSHETITKYLRLYLKSIPQEKVKTIANYVGFCEEA